MTVLALGLTGGLGSAQPPVGVRMTGTVTDSQGNLLPDVEIRIEVFERDTSITASAKTNKKGQYAAIMMHPSRSYRYTVRKQGFATLEEFVDIGIARVDIRAPLERDFVMAPAQSAGAATEEVQLFDRKGPHPAAKPYNRGVQAFNAGRWEEARAYFEKAVKRDSRLTIAQVGLANTCIRLGDFATAAAAAERALELEPGRLDMLGVRYDAYSQLGDEAMTSQALQELTQAMAERQRAEAEEP